jgi:nucleotide-binding universal stress UspA family protein
VNLKRILFATDFSPTSDTALAYASSLASDSGALLLIAHVEELAIPMGAEPIYFSPPPFPNPEVRRQLETVVPTVASVRYEHRLVTGSVAEEIVALAEAEGADLIVIGTHGRSGLRRILVGSVAEAVMRHAKCPVLTVKPNTPSSADQRQSAAGHRSTSG